MVLPRLHASAVGWHRTVRRKYAWLLVIAASLGGAPPQAEAQAPAGPIRVGLALSGGSAKGFAHIGVLRILEREGVPVHVVAGTSMGAIVGGLYALGVSVDSLEALADGLDWDALFTDRVERDHITAPGHPGAS